MLGRAHAVESPSLEYCAVAHLFGAVSCPRFWHLALSKF
ncbi:hypothetical protein APV28_4304 [Comamonas testosteroni]|nr:hypothetical protein APV28_4304 [Comamonas testosteroni]